MFNYIAIFLKKDAENILEMNSEKEEYAMRSKYV